MKISAVSNNNPNFEKLIVSKKTLKSLGCTHQELLNNDFINKWSQEYDICISGNNNTLLQKATSFTITIARKIKSSLFSRILKNKDDEICATQQFNTLEELNPAIDSIKEKTYKDHCITKFHYAYRAFSELKKGNPHEFIAQMDYLMLQIASIPNTPEYEELNNSFLSILKDLRFWKPLPKRNPNIPVLYGDYWKEVNLDIEKSAGLRAIESNNIELLKFLKEKGENLNQCLDLLQEGNVSDEVREILKDVKYQSTKIFELEDCIHTPFLVEKFFAENPDIDINSRNREGDTLVLKAVKTGNEDLLKFLATRDDVNWNAYDANGENALILALKKKDFDVIYRIVHLPPDKINASNLCLSYVDTRRPLISALEYAVKERHSYIEYVTKFPSANVMDKTMPYDDPLVFLAIEEELWSWDFMPLILHPSFNIYEKNSEGKNIVEFTANSKFDRYAENINKALPQIALNEIKSLYEKNGELTLEQLETFVETITNNSKSKRLELNKITFNSIDDTIGHLLCDIQIDINDLQKMSKMGKIIRILDKKQNYDFKTANGIDQTPLTKAIEAENTGLVKLLLQFYKYERFYIRELISKCESEEIINILKEEL
ncbi:MAG: ankyrin repeat domain-containing protein [Candidatus Gastranaerophilales bacterium]|nr:ankyrin repeat domain-containing protein [Candidatus Gastranaerophilales bacterium]MCM1072420.1 ankyrin repeat domain-containing protein [Bacteroides sp.]